MTTALATWPEICPTCGTALVPDEVAPGIRIPVDSETTTFNDDPTTTHADVLDLFDRAIEATR